MKTPGKNNQLITAIASAIVVVICFSAMYLLASLMILNTHECEVRVDKSIKSQPTFEIVLTNRGRHDSRYTFHLVDSTGYYRVGSIYVPNNKLFHGDQYRVIIVEPD